MSNGRPSTPGERETAEAMYRDGVPYTQIAAALDRPIGSVANFISAAMRDGRVTRRYVPLSDGDF